MKYCVLAMVAAAGLFATPASATDSVAVIVQTTVPPVCSFTTKPAAVQSIAPVAGEYNLGDLGYTCNFPGNANVTLMLPQGTMLHSSAPGATDHPYGLRWLVPPNGSGTAYQTFTAGAHPFTWPTAPTPNTETKGAVMIKLDTNLPVAGTYMSSIGYTITP